MDMEHLFKMPNHAGPWEATFRDGWADAVSANRLGQVWTAVGWSRLFDSQPSQSAARELRHLQQRPRIGRRSALDHRLVASRALALRRRKDCTSEPRLVATSLPPNANVGRRNPLEQPWAWFCP
jgi:hypothetical protein